MVRKLILLCMLPLWGSVHAQAIELRLSGGQQANDGTGTILLAQDDEYSLKVVCDRQPDEVVIAGIDQSSLFRIGNKQVSQRHMYDHRGTHSTVTHSYNLTPQVLGEHIIGPATMVAGGQSYDSNRIRVRVLDAASFDRMFSGRKKGGGLSCKITLDSAEVVVSQPVTVTVTMEGGQEVLKHGLQPPSFGTMTFAPQGDATSEQRLVNGQVRTLVTQKFRASADTPGKYTVGPAIAHFVLPDENSHDPFSAFFQMGLGGMMGGSMGKKRSVRSNSVELTVKPLPHSEISTDGIGQFSHFTMQADKRVVDLNEPFPVRLAISGIGNFDAMLPPELQVPAHMTVYDATGSFKPHGHGSGSGTKTFEYIVQIEQDGEQQIPAQTFTYYNTATGQHETMHSEPLLVHVKAARITAPVPTSVPEHDDDEYDDDEDELFDDDELIQVRGGAEGLSWWWLLFIMGVPLFYLSRRRLRALLFSASERFGITSQEKRDAQTLKQLIAAQEVTSLHRFFVTVLAQYCDQDKGAIDGTFAQQQATVWGWDVKKQEAFATFIEGCGQAAFAPQLMPESEKNILLSKAGYWFALIVQETRK